MMGGLAVAIHELSLRVIDLDNRTSYGLLLVIPAVKPGLHGCNIVPATGKTRKEFQPSPKENARNPPLSIMSST